MYTEKILQAQEKEDLDLNDTSDTEWGPRNCSTSCQCRVPRSYQERFVYRTFSILLNWKNLVCILENIWEKHNFQPASLVSLVALCKWGHSSGKTPSKRQSHPTSSLGSTLYKTSKPLSKNSNGRFSVIPNPRYFQNTSLFGHRKPESVPFIGNSDPHLSRKLYSIQSIILLLASNGLKN